MRVVFGVCGLEEEAWAESTQCGRNSGTHCTADELYKFGQVITALFLSFTQPFHKHQVLSVGLADPVPRAGDTELIVRALMELIWGHSASVKWE